MKAMTVVNAFVDRETGETVKAGAVLPKGFDKDRISALKRMGCVAEVAVERKAKRQNPAREAAPDAQEMFPDAGADAVAGGDGGGDRAGAEPDAGGRGGDQG